MKQQEMSATIRHDFGKGAMHRLRQSGHAPAILYGCKSEPIALKMDAKTLTRDLLNLLGHNAVVSLDIAGEKDKKTHHVLIKAIQTDPVTDTVLHVDFLEIELESEIVMDVPVLYTGTAKGVDMGGILNIMAYTVKIKGKPLDIPDDIEVDITSLEMMGQGITCGDLSVPDNVVMVEEPGRVCVSVVAPKAVEEEVVEEEAEEEAGEEAAAETEEAPPATEE